MGPGEDAQGPFTSRRGDVGDPGVVGENDVGLVDRGDDVGPLRAAAQVDDVARVEVAHQQIGAQALGAGADDVNLVRAGEQRDRFAEPVERPLPDALVGEGRHHGELIVRHAG